MIMGPEGELINVGGTIKPHLRDIDLVHDANKVFGKGEEKSCYRECLCKGDFSPIRKF